MPEVLCLGTLVAQTLFMTVQDDVVGRRTDVVSQIDGLRNIVKGRQRKPVGQTVGQLDNRLLAHSIDDNVGRSITQQAGPQPVLPVVVVSQSAQ